MQDRRSRLNFKSIDAADHGSYDARSAPGHASVATPNPTHMNFIPSFVWRAIALIVLALASTGCDAPSGVSAVVLATKGEVRAVERNTGPLRPGEFLRPPMSIRTGPDSAVVVAALPGIMIRLERESEFSLTVIALHKRGEDIESRMVRARLTKGRAAVWVDEFRRGGLEFRLDTPAGEVQVVGPVLAEISVEADAATRIVCASGGLAAARFPLVGGQWLQLAPGTGRPVPREAADTDAIWSILLNLRNVEPQFIDLQDRQHDRTPKRFSEWASPVPKK